MASLPPALRDAFLTGQVDAFDMTGVSGVDPNRADYGTFIFFDDPDGNSWAIQEVKHHVR